MVCISLRRRCAVSILAALLVFSVSGTLLAGSVSPAAAVSTWSKFDTADITSTCGTSNNCLDILTVNVWNNSNCSNTPYGLWVQTYADGFDDYWVSQNYAQETSGVWQMVFYVQILDSCNCNPSAPKYVTGIANVC